MLVKFGKQYSKSMGSDGSEIFFIKTYAKLKNLKKLLVVGGGA